jgi:hypothetical protein
MNAKQGFYGRVITGWVDDGRKMLLLEDYSYIDKSGKKWTAKSGSITDGASIPRIFWRLIGSPFTGKYRHASILHDSYYFIPRGEPRIKIDLMFYEAMLFSGVPMFKAKLIYLAVRFFGGFSFNSRFR